MIRMTGRISGTSLPQTAFRVHETNESVDVSAVFEVLRGNLAAYRIRGFVAPAVCRRIVENFWASTERVARYGEGEDGVEAYLIGASHYGKPTGKYLQEVRASQEAVKRLYDGTTNPLSVFREALASETSGVKGVRPARLNGFEAGDSKAICWNNSGAFLLEPHDDVAQLKDPEQGDFEIQQPGTVMALNIYVEVPVNSGQIQIWNVEPDDHTRAELGLTFVGFPYPAGLLAEYPSAIIGVETGDLCVVNGNLVHAVLRGNMTSPAKRLLITCFMGLNHGNELIWWS